MLEHILHERDESNVLEILRDVRNAMAARQERTAAEYTKLMDRTGFRNTRAT